MTGASLAYDIPRGPRLPLKPSIRAEETRQPRYVPQPKQRIFHEDPALYRLYGGAAGGGKSHALRWELIRQCAGTPGWHTLLLRASFPELEQHKLEFRDECPGLLKGEIATFPNGSTLRFGYTKRDADITRYQGDAYGCVAWDELTHFSLYQWQYLSSRNRSKTGKRSHMIAASNPGGKGHGWVKALWLEGRDPDPNGTEGFNPKDYSFTRALLQDNPILEKKDPLYRKKLERLPAHLRQALLLGDWDVIAGAYYAEVWDPERHITTRKPERWHKRWCSMDWGWRHPAVVQWFAQDDQGDILVYRERVFDHTSEHDIARAVVEESGDEVIEAFYLDPSAFAKKTDERTIAEQLGDILGDNQSGIGCMPMPAINARVSGWRLIYGLLDEGRLQIHESCKEIIRTLPLMQHPGPGDPGDPEDCLKLEGIDDSPDTLRYGVASHIGITQIPYEVRVQRRMDALAASRGVVVGQEAAMRARIVEQRERGVDKPMHFRRGR